MPGVSWAAVFAGAVASLALTLVLLSFGAGMGFSVVSPWGNSGFSATTYLGSALAVGTFKASDVAQMINENGTTPDGVAVRECLFPGGKAIKPSRTSLLVNGSARTSEIPSCTAKER